MQFEMVTVIKIKVGKRQRLEMKDIDELAASIKQNGMLQPIVVDDKLNLIAGGRRLAAAKLLKWPEIWANFLGDLSLAERKLLELEENIKRSDLTWKEEAFAVIEYHEIRSKEKGWTQAKSAESLGFASDSAIVERVAVVQALKENNTYIQEAMGLRPAYNILSRTQGRAMDDAMEDVFDKMEDNLAEEAAARKGEPPPEKAKVKRDRSDSSILQADFIEWADNYSGPKFNLIHCDFPYGIGHDKSDQGGSKQRESYKDDLETYANLCAALNRNIDKLAAQSCHLIFWFSMASYEWTRRTLSPPEHIVPEFEMFTINPYPLLWLKSDGRGILPDSNRGPRQIYETVFFGHRGDRKIIRAVSNAIAHPQGEKSHLSEKPQEVLEHFFRMTVDLGTRILDPTCGSGNALAVAKRMGAEYVLGLDTSEESVKLARRNLSAATRENRADGDPLESDAL